MLTTDGSRALLNGVARPFDAAGRPPCLLAFHGFTGSPSELGPVLNAVAEAGFAVRAPVHPGHGTTPADLQSKRFDDWLTAARDELRVAKERHGRVVVLGFSMGSLVALRLAAETPIDGLVAMGNALFLHAHSRWPLALFDRLERAPDLYLRKPRAADLEDRSLASSIVTYDRHPVRAAHEVFRAGKTTREHLGGVRAPTLILHGARDRVCPASNAAFLASKLTGAPSVEVRTFERSAHVLGCDRERAEVAATVVAFLERVQTPVEP